MESLAHTLLLPLQPLNTCQMFPKCCEKKHIYSSKHLAIASLKYFRNIEQVVQMFSLNNWGPPKKCINILSRFSLSVSRYTQDFLCSVVLGDDIVGRLGLVTAYDLKMRIFQIIRDCDTPKVCLIIRSNRLQLYESSGEG